MKPAYPKLIFFLSCLIALFLAAGCGHKGPQSYKDLNYPPLTKWPETKIEHFKLKNGIKVFLTEDHELPLISVTAKIRAGAVQVPKGKQGLEKILAEAMRTGGSKDYPGEKLDLILENNAARLNINIGFQSSDLSMNFLKQDAELMFNVFTDVLANPLLPEDKIVLAKRHLSSQIARRNDEQSGIAFREFDRLIYNKDSVYGRIPEYETISRIKAQDLEKFHSKAFKGKNILISVVGDFQTKKMKKLIQKTLSKIESGSKNKLQFPKVNYSYAEELYLVDKPDVNQSYVLMGHIGDFRQNKDYAELQLLNQVLSGGFSGILFQKIRTKLGLAYSVFGRYGCNYFYPGKFFVGLQTKSQSTLKAIQKVKQELIRIKQEGISKEKLKNAKDQFLNSLVFRYDTTEEIVGRRLYYEYRQMPPDSFKQLIQEIKEATAADISRVASLYLRPEKMQVLVVGNKKKILDQLKEFGPVKEIEID